jgi:glycerol-3-phosphate dehydrogenase
LRGGGINSGWIHVALPSDINRDAPSVVVIGGGATGCAMARDLALRGMRVTLIEAGDLGAGTSSRFHGMLQSGARYALSDTAYAAECMRERQIVARLIPEAVEPVGGLFVSLKDEPGEFADRFIAGCAAAQIPVTETDAGEVMRAEPSLSRSIERAFTVPDASINPWRLLNALAADIERLGGTVLKRHRVVAIKVVNGRARSVEAEFHGGTRVIACDAVVNAAGPWTGKIASLVDQQVDLQLTKGSILVLAHRMVGRIVNRCRPPSSHDIIVPTGTVSLFGTTSEAVDDPGTTTVRPEEVQELLDGAEPLIPDIRRCRALRVWAGVRPLVKPADWPAGQSLPRRHKVIDHSTQGLSGFISVCGGSLTTHRSMAEDAGDHVCRQLGWNAASTSAELPFGSGGTAFWNPVKAQAETESVNCQGKLLCECEAVTVAAVDALLANGSANSLHDLRRRLRVGFGPCQGTFCAPRAANRLVVHHPAVDGANELHDLWIERLKGMAPVAWGVQARQVLLSDAIYERILGLSPVAISQLHNGS